MSESNNWYVGTQNRLKTQEIYQEVIMLWNDSKLMYHDLVATLD